MLELDSACVFARCVWEADKREVKPSVDTQGGQVEQIALELAFLSGNAETTASNFFCALAAAIWATAPAYGCERRRSKVQKGRQAPDHSCELGALRMSDLLAAL
ncbi:hypothetical protein Efla_004394 [Eimeria flavescens]